MKRDISPPIVAVLIGVAVIAVFGLFWKFVVISSTHTENAPSSRRTRS
jgi:hypothetical protein